MALDAAAVIRAGSSSLYVLLGLAVLALGRRSKGALVLGTFLLALGLNTFLNNVLDDWPDPVAVLVIGTWGLSAATIPFVLPSSPDPAERRAALLALLPATVILVSAVSISVVSNTPWITRAFSSGGFAVLACAASARVAVRGRGVEFRRAAALLAPIAFAVPFLAFVGSTVHAGSFGILALAVVPCACWLAAGVRTGERFPVVVGVAIAALGFLSYAYLPFQGEVRDPWGVYGILRIAGWAVLVHAIVRHDLLGVPLPRVAMNRGALAAGTLATLFIVAQVAQNFLEAQYGLLMGGVVAGAFLFAAQPIQRAIEGRSLAPAPAPTPGPTMAGREEAYRHALHFALKDRVLTPEERIRLAHLADELGLTARRAAELESDALREANRWR